MAVQGDRDDAPGAEDFQREALSPVAAPVLTRDIVVVGASAGGVEALTELVHGLPPDFPAAVFIVLHVMPTSSSMLPSILNRRCPLPVTSASDGEPIERGHIYVAPPDHHMLLVDETIRVTRGPRENGHRPAVDPLFRTAAQAFGPRVIGIVLSGALDDGTLGLGLVKRAGGVAIVQDLDEALHRDMPASACRHVDVDHVVRVHDMPKLIGGLLEADARPRSKEDVSSKDVSSKKDPALQDAPDPVLAPPSSRVMKDGFPSTFSCPECGSVLLEYDDGNLRHFRCQVGHAYSAGSLVTEQGKSVESALWVGVRSLEERADLHRRLARRAGPGREPVVSRFEAQARRADDHANELRATIGRLLASRDEDR